MRVQLNQNDNLGNNNGYSSVAPSAGRILWPDAVAFREAIQNPSLALGDFELQRANVAVDKRGLPVAYSGRFAVVFKLQTATGEAWALRCFTSPGDGESGVERGDRYRVIASHLSKLGDAFVPFRYVEQGIKVGREWFPVVAMQWASGTTLGRWVEGRRHEPDALHRLCGSLTRLLETLENAGIAHGDWQHDNLLVEDDGESVTLVDYDGLFVPELAGLPAPEIGHANYQHPARTSAHFGPGLDRFACLVIQTALLGVARDPGLWDRFADGESFLFKKADLADPAHSRVFEELRAVAELYDDEELADSLARLLDAIKAGPQSALLPVVAASPAPVRIAKPKQAARPAEFAWGGAAVGGKWWLDEGRETVTLRQKPRPASGTWSGFSQTASMQQMTAVPNTFIARATSVDALQAESKYLWQARMGAAVMLFFALLFLWSLFSSKMGFPFYLFFWVFNLATLGYNRWPRRKIYDELNAQIAQMEKLTDERRAQILQKRRGGYPQAAPVPNLGSANDFVNEKLINTPISGLGGYTGFPLTVVRELRANGIENALQLRGRAAIPGLQTYHLTVIQQWVHDLEMDAASEYRKLMAQRPGVSADVSRLEQEAQEFERERDRLARERDQFPDVAFGGYLRRLVGLSEASPSGNSGGGASPAGSP